MATNGGFTAYADRTTTYGNRGSEPYKATRPITVKEGQVLKAMTWLESDSSGKMIAHGNIAEQASVAWAGTLKSGDTVAFAGLTYTATADSTAAEVVAGILGGVGTYTKGGVTLTSSAVNAIWALSAGSTSVIILAKGLQFGTNPTDVVATVTNTSTTSTLAGTVTTSPSGTTTVNRVAGLLAFDVDATSADTAGQMFISGNFWEEEILWVVDTAVDTVEKSDGTTVAVTAYNTGCVTSLAKQKFLEYTAGGTEFVIGTWTAGEREA